MSSYFFLPVALYLRPCLSTSYVLLLYFPMFFILLQILYIFSLSLTSSFLRFSALLYRFTTLANFILKDCSMFLVFMVRVQMSLPYKRTEAPMVLWNLLLISGSILFCRILWMIRYINCYITTHACPYSNVEDFKLQ